MYRFLITIAVLVFSVYSDDSPSTAALNQITGSGMEEGEAIALTNALRGELTRTGKFDMMERSQIAEILTEQGFQLSGACADDACLVEMGQLLAVRYMFMGHVGRVGETYSVSVRQIDVKNGRVVKDVTENHRGAIDDVLTMIMPSIARQFAGMEEVVVEKKRRIWPWIVGGVLAAGAVPVVLFLTNDTDEETDSQSSEFIIDWQ